MSGPLLLGLRIAMAVSLYAFLGFILYIQWSELRQQSGLVAPSQPPTIILMIAKDEQELRYRFELTEIIIGRDPVCDLMLSDSTVSAKHARINFKHSQWWLEDMNSTNGTMLSEQQVNIPVVITSGDLFTCGQVEISVEIEGDHSVVNPKQGEGVNGRSS